MVNDDIMTIDQAIKYKPELANNEEFLSGVEAKKEQAM